MSVPLSRAQRGLWYIQAADPASSTYNVSVMLRWNGPVDGDALQTALDAVVSRHDALRTRFSLLDGEPVQEISPVTSPIIHIGASSMTDAEAAEQAAAQAARPFALDRDAPMRCVVWHGLPTGDVVLLCMHHIVVDAWSLRVLLADLGTAYDAALSGSNPKFPAPGLRYVDYAAWESAREDSESVRQLLRRRVEQLSGIETNLRLGAFDSPTAGVVSRVARFDFPSAFKERLGTVATELRVTPFVVLLAAFEEVVRRWSTRTIFLLGTVMIHRPLPELDRTVGYFLNTVPIRCDVRPERTFAEQCRIARTEFADAMRAQAIPFEDLVQQLCATNSAERDERPLIQVGIGLLPSRVDEPSRYWRLEDLIPAAGAAVFDLTLLIELDAECPNALVEYDARRCPAFVAEGLCADYVALLGAALDDRETVLARLPIAESRIAGGRQGVLVGPDEDLIAWHQDRRSALPAQKSTDSAPLELA